MNRVVVELKGNLVFCGVDKGECILEGENGMFVETDSEYGLSVWCPNKMIEKVHKITIDEEDSDEFRTKS